MSARVGLLLYLLLLGGCSNELSTEIRFVGLDDSPCDSGGLVLFGQVPLQVVSSGDHELKRVSIYAGDSDQPLEDDQAPFQVLLDTTKLATSEGDLRLTAVGLDDEDQTVTTTIIVCVDNLPPNLDLKEPQDGDAFGLEDATLEVSYVAQDQLGLERITASLDLPQRHLEQDCPLPEGSKETSCQLEPAKLGLTITPGSTIEAELRLIARDKAGNEQEESALLKLGTRLLWSVPTQTISREVALLPQGGVVAGTDARELLVVHEGEISCSCSLPDPPQGIDQREIMTALQADPTGSNVYFATYQTLWAIDIDACVSGQQCSATWSTSAPSGYFSSPRLALYSEGGGQGLIFAGRTGTQAEAGQLDAYDLATGVRQASIEITSLSGEPVVKSAPVLDPEEQLVYIGSPSQTLHAIDFSELRGSGELAERWSSDLNEAIKTSPVVSGERVYVAGENIVHALDRNTGQPAAGFNPFSCEQGLQSSLALSDLSGLLYVGCLDTKLYALSSGGEQQGEITIGAMPAGTAPVIAADGVIYATTVSEPSRVYALSGDLGQVLWSFAAPGGGEFSAAPVISGDTLYIGNQNGYLYALDLTLAH